MSHAAKNGHLCHYLLLHAVAVLCVNTLTDNSGFHLHTWRYVVSCMRCVMSCERGVMLGCRTVTDRCCLCCRTKTPGPGAQSALRALARSGMKIGRIGELHCLVLLNLWIHWRNSRWSLSAKCGTGSEASLLWRLFIWNNWVFDESRKMSVFDFNTPVALENNSQSNERREISFEFLCTFLHTGWVELPKKYGVWTCRFVHEKHRQILRKGHSMRGSSFVRGALFIRAEQWRVGVVQNVCVCILMSY